MQGLHAIQQIYTPSLCVSLDLSTEIWQLLVTATGSASSYALLKQSKPSALNFIPINENKSLSNAVSDVTPLLTDERLLGHFWFVQVYTIVSFCRQQRSSDYLIQKHQQLWVRAREDLRLLGVPALCIDHQTPFVIACCSSCFMPPQNYIAIIRD